MLDTCCYRSTFPGRADQVRVVRKGVGEYLAHCAACDDVVLIASELATNAIRHSLSRFGHFTVRVERYDTHVYPEVEDAGGPWVPRPQDGRSHHGLDIVAALARTWGITPLPGGCVVWAAVGL